MEPSSMRRFSSPDTMSPSLMVSSQALWPRSCSATSDVCFMKRLLCGSGLLGLREHHGASLGIGGAHDAMTPRHVRGRALEHDALGRERFVRAVDVLHHEVERRLLRGAGLAHVRHRRHEPEARRRAGLDPEIVEVGIAVEVLEPEDLRVEALDRFGVVRRVVEVVAHRSDPARRRRRSRGARGGGGAPCGRLLRGALSARGVLVRGSLARRLPGGLLTGRHTSSSAPSRRGSNGIGTAVRPDPPHNSIMPQGRGRRKGRSTGEYAGVNRVWRWPSARALGSGLALAMTVSSTGHALAGAWLREPGEAYAKGSVARLTGDEVFDAAGKRQPLDDPLLYSNARYREVNA